MKNKEGERKKAQWGRAEEKENKNKEKKRQLIKDEVVGSIRGVNVSPQLSENHCVFVWVLTAQNKAQLH